MPSLAVFGRDPSQIRGIGSVFNEKYYAQEDSLNNANVLIRELNNEGFNDVELLTFNNR